MTELKKTNDYSAGIHRLSDENLQDYINKPGDYQDDAVLAAIWEIELRRPLKSQEKVLEAEISGRTFVKDLAIKKDSLPGFPSKENELPSLYSIRSIQIFSVLFSVLAGGILMAINFNRTTQKAEAIKVLSFSLAYTFISLLIFTLLGSTSPIISIFLNLLGAFLIYELFWKRVLGIEFRFRKQNIWPALIISLILISPLIWYVIKTGGIQTI